MDYNYYPGNQIGRPTNMLFYIFEANGKYVHSRNVYMILNCICFHFSLSLAFFFTMTRTVVKVDTTSLLAASFVLNHHSMSPTNSSSVLAKPLYFFISHDKVLELFYILTSCRFVQSHMLLFLIRY